MKLARRAVLAGAGAVFVARAHAGPAVPSAASLARAVAPSRDALPLWMKDADGHRLSLADQAGRLVVLNLWASWCLPCRREMPSLSRLAAQLDGHDRIAVLPLAFDWRGLAAVRRFYAETGITNLPMLLGDGENLSATLGLERLPSTAIINAHGQHVLTVAGEAVWDDDATCSWLRGLAG